MAQLETTRRTAEVEHVRAHAVEQACVLEATRGAGSCVENDQLSPRPHVPTQVRKPERVDIVERLQRIVQQKERHASSPAAQPSARKALRATTLACEEEKTSNGST